MKTFLYICGWLTLLSNILFLPENTVTTAALLLIAALVSLGAAAICGRLDALREATAAKLAGDCSAAKIASRLPAKPVSAP